MFEGISIIVALAGTFLASLWDLKTTEVPDPIPYAMIGIGLAIALLQSFIYRDFSQLADCLFSGFSLLVFGALMYFLGQWGGADALILAGVGFLLPKISKPKLLFPFPFSYLLNVFIIGAIYMIIYALIFAVLNKKIILSFFKEVKASKSILSIGSFGLFILFIGINYLVLSFLHLPIQHFFVFKNSLLLLIITLGIYLLLKFVKVVEEVGFKKRIPVSKLKVGDVLAEEKFWKGISEKEIEKIKKSGKKFVWIKEGVRFAPTFFLALIFTLYYGDGISLIYKILIGI
jgi:type IV secretory pathway VirB3-like protein